MGLMSAFMIHHNWRYLLAMVAGILPCMAISILYSKVCSKTAHRLGDSTGTLNGRDGFHPLEQLDGVGFLLFVTTGIGWSPPLPVEPKNFRKPLLDSFRILCTGSLSLLGVGIVFLGIASALYQGFPTVELVEYLVFLSLQVSVLSVGFAFSQWIPFPCFGLFHWIEQQWQGTKPPHEKSSTRKGYVTILVAVLLWSGYAQPLLTSIVGGILKPFCIAIPFSLVEFYFL